jgi:HlyD family secretion protein
VKVDEYDLTAVSIRQKSNIKNKCSDLQVGGVVSKISKQATVVNGVSFLPTKITIDDNENLRVGMSCEIKIVNESVKDATTISMKALQFDNYNQPYVYLQR